ncbi:MAG: hypothetical protein CSA70_11290 [Rhodobacterales bacterium]|nr:MAG: hypothetical protein CSA70_11290 [Rhodobacterales bacterium]
MKQGPVSRLESRPGATGFNMKGDEFVFQVKAFDLEPETRKRAKAARHLCVSRVLPKIRESGFWQDALKTDRDRVWEFGAAPQGLRGHHQLKMNVQRPLSETKHGCFPLWPNAFFVAS